MEDELMVMKVPDRSRVCFGRTKETPARGFEYIESPSLETRGLLLFQMSQLQIPCVREGFRSQCSPMVFEALHET